MVEGIMDAVNDKDLKKIQEKVFVLLCVFKDICEKENIWYSLSGGTMLGAVRHHGFIPWDSDADVVIMLPDKERFREAFYKHKPEGILLGNYDKDKHNLHSHDTLYFENNDGYEMCDIHLDIFPQVGAPSDYKKQKRFAKSASIWNKIVKSKYVNLKKCLKKNRFLVFCAKIFDFFIPDKCLKSIIRKKENKYDFGSSQYVMAIANYGKAENCIPKQIYSEMIKQEFNGVNFLIPKEYDVYLTRYYGADYMKPRRY